MRTEFLTIFWRDMVKFFRSRSLLFSSLVQPALWLVLYGVSMSSNFNLISPVTSQPVGGVAVNYLTFMAAGVISMTVLFTCLYSGVSLQFDKQYGLMKEMVASPMPRPHIVLGISLSGVAKSLIQATIIVLFGLVLGVQFFAGYSIGQILFSILGIFAFVMLFALGLMFLSVYISMKIESHEGTQGVITLLTLPLFFASNALYPVNSLPSVIQGISYLNPLSYFISGLRFFSIGSNFNLFGTTYTYGVGDVALSFGFLAGFALVMYLLAVGAVKKAKIV